MIIKKIINEENFYNGIIFLYIVAVYALPYKVLEIEIIFIILSLLKIKKIKKNGYLIWNFCFLFICLGSVVYSIQPLDSFIKVFQILRLFIIGNIFICIVNKKIKLEKIYNYFILAGFYMIGVLLMKFPTEDLGKVRLNTMDFNANDIGFKLAISLMFCLYFIIIKHKQNILYYLMVPIIYIFIFFTGSRKAFIFAFFGNFIMFILNFKNKKKLILTSIISLILILILYNILMRNQMFYQLLGQRIDGAISGLNNLKKMDSSSLKRFYMIQKGIYLWKEKPFLGYGIDSYKYISGFGVYSHNNFVELLVSVGVLGMLLYYSFYVYLFNKLFKLIFNNTKEVIPLLIICIFLILSSFAMVFYYSRLCSLLITLSFIAIKLYKKN